MPSTPSSATKKKKTTTTTKKKSGTKEANSMPNDRERGMEEEEEALANAFVAASLGPNAQVTGVGPSATGGGGGRDTTRPTGPPCGGCKKPFVGTMLCSRCESVYYCGRDCQLHHWSAGHKAVCRQMKMGNEATAKHVLAHFNDALGCWTDLDASGAYKAAVRQGLHNKIREALELEKAKIVDRYHSGRGAFTCYASCVMTILFRGQRAGGLASANRLAETGVDGPRVEGYVKSHRGALDAWLQASFQLLCDVTDSALLRNPLLHHIVHKAANDVWFGWTMVFTSATASRAILMPFPSPATKGETDGSGETVDQRRKRGEDHARRIVKTLAAGLRLVKNDSDPDPNSTIYISVMTVCALVQVRVEEYGIGIDVEGILNLDEHQTDMFQFLELPMAKRTIEKGAVLNPQEYRAVMDVAQRQLGIR